ncbi:MAG: sensor histidine kinase [Solirubrobacteraceae bacterium]
MSRSLLTLLLAALLAAAGTLPVAPAGDALIIFAMLLALGGGALALAHLAAARRRRLGSLRRQFSFTIAIAAGQIVVAVIVFAELMFTANHDAVIIIALAAFAAVITARAVALFAAGVMRDVEQVRDGLAAVGSGDRSPVLRTEGQDELAELAASANAMTAQLAAEEEARDAADGARRSLVAAVSHDLRTPLTSLRLLAEALQDDIVDDATRRTYLADMATHINALSALIDDLFELSRLEAGEIQWSMERVALGELVDETVAAMRLQAAAKGVDVRAEIDGHLAAAQANPEKVQRVLFNLIQNAIRHTPADGAVVVRAEPGPDRVEIEVADTGHGIPAAERPRVFDAFYRGGDGQARTEPGGGMGLAISRAIVEAHGGRIWLADSSLGTRVRFSLPRAG